MAKDKFSDYSSTNASNTDIGGIDIQGTGFISNGDNALREGMTHIADHFASDTIASATTTDLGSKAAHYLTVSGTTTITGFGTVKAGTTKGVTFSGALTLTHNATSLILPGGENITTAAGDTAVFVSEGSGNWRCVSYTKASGEQITPVSYGIEQSLSTTEQAQARSNIIAGHAMQGLRSMNALVNPFFAVSQENGRNVMTVSGDHGADNAFATFGSGAFNHGTKAAAFSGMPVPFHFMYEMVCTTTGSTDYKQIFHTIEADRLLPFGFGTTFAVPALFAGIVETNFTGKVCITLGNHDVTRTCAIEVDVTADTPQLVVLEFPADTGGSWKTLAGELGGGLRVIGAASSTAASAGVWGTGVATAAATEWGGATGRKVRWLPFGMFPKRLGLTKAMLEGLTLADWAWLMQPYSVDLRDARRYWQSRDTLSSSTHSATSTSVKTLTDFYEPMCKTPTVSFEDDLGASGNVLLRAAGGGTLGRAAPGYSNAFIDNFQIESAESCAFFTAYNIVKNARL